MLRTARWYHPRYCANKAVPRAQIKFVLLLSRQGKVRLSKWYTTLTQKERAKIIREITPMVLARPLKLCNFLDWKDNKVRCPDIVS